MPSYHVEIREDIIYNRLPLEEQLYTGFKAGCLESGANITSSELVSELTYSMDTRGRRVVTIPSKEVTGKGLPKRQVVSSVVVSNQSSYVYSDKKKLKLNFTNQWRFRKNASQLGKESSITSHS